MNLLEAKKNPYAWPGGYPIYAIMDDGELLCTDCFNDPSNPIHEGGEADGWRYEGADVYWEGETLPCAHCGRMVIESAYGPVEEAKP